MTDSERRAVKNTQKIAALAVAAGSFILSLVTDAARRTLRITRKIAAFAGATDSAPRRSLAVAASISIAVVWLATEPMSTIERFGDPPVVVNLTSDVVVFVPAENVNLVTAARPRHGILASGGIYEGIRFEPPPSLSAVIDLLHPEAPEPERADSTGTVVVKHLEVTPGCEIRIERLPDARIDLGIRPDPLAARESDDDGNNRECMFQAEITNIGDASPIRIRRSLAASEEVGLRFRPSDRPLRLRLLTIRDLGFTEKGERGVRSAILGGTVRLPVHGNQQERLEFGDRLRFGQRVRGDIVELSVGDTLRTIFRGTVSEPTIENRSLGPSILRHLYYVENFRIFAGVILGALVLIFAWFQIN